jgi:protein-L-isoaspartate(D-aspartate) O-methyltransferase
MTRPSRFPMALDRVRPSPGRARASGRGRRVAPAEAAAPCGRSGGAPGGAAAGWAWTRRPSASAWCSACATKACAMPALLQAFGAVERHRFVDSALATQAYEDTSLPIGWQQTISKPSVVARMLDLLLQGQAARRPGSPRPCAGNRHRLRLPGGLAGPPVAQRGLHRAAGAAASERRGQPGRPAGRRCAAGARRRPPRAMPPNAPYTSIVAAAGGDELPAAWLDQLALGGRLVAPMHDASGGAARCWWWSTVVPKAW